MRTTNQKPMYRAMIFLWVSFFLLPLFQAQAQETNQLRLHRRDASGEQGVAGVQFAAWRVADEVWLSTYEHLLETVNAYTVAELDARYGAGRRSEPTDVDGFTEWTGLEDGVFYVREVSPKEAAMVPFLVELPDGGERVRDVYPKPAVPEEKGVFLLEKTDAASRPLEGVRFRLWLVRNGQAEAVPLNAQYEYDLNGSYERILQTDAKGQIRVTKLPPGRYRWEEVQPLPGYRPLGEPVERFLPRNAEQTLSVVNERQERGSFRFRKVNAQAEPKPLAGARFALYQKKEADWVRVQSEGQDLVLTSGADGFFEARDLPFGEYALYEIASPPGYRPREEHIYFTVDADSGSASRALLITNEPGPPVERPPKPPVKTGDIVLRLWVGLGLTALFFLGWLRRGRKMKQQP